MTITAEQLEARTRGIGASDAHVLAGIDGPGGATLLDLWCHKRRGADLQIDPLVPPEHAPESPELLAEVFSINSDPRAVGNAFESSVVALYEAETGRSTAAHETMVHPDHAWARANPDRVIVPDVTGQQIAEAFGTESKRARTGLECKMVGRWGADRWGADGLPAHVVCQAQWSMLCSGYERWDVAAWIAGTEARIVPVLRDDELCDRLLELGERFWVDHVLANEPPEPSSGDDLQRFLGRRFPRDDGEVVELPGEMGEQAALLAAELNALKVEIKRLETLKKGTTARLCALTGKHAGVEGPWGRFTYRGQQGRVSWKNIAAEVAGAPIRDEVLERHRGAPFRVGRLSMFKAKWC